MIAIRDDVIFGWASSGGMRAKMRVAYEHGLDADGELVHIADAERGGRYSCAGCGKRLVAVLGDKRPRRFRHCTAEDRANCSTEHAIRRIAKMSVTYEHGLDADGALVHIADAERGGQCFCAGCGKRLIEVLGDERPLSFRHCAAADGDACEPEHAIFRMAKLAIVAGWRAAKANGWEYPIVMPRGVARRTRAFWTRRTLTTRTTGANWLRERGLMPLLEATFSRTARRIIPEAGLMSLFGAGARRRRLRLGIFQLCAGQW